jgi:hypothetical protein
MIITSYKVNSDELTSTMDLWIDGINPFMGNNQIVNIVCTKYITSILINIKSEKIYQ